MKQTSSKSVERGLKDLAREEIEPFHYERTMAHVRDKLSFPSGLKPDGNNRRNPMKIALQRSAIVTGAIAVLFIAMLLIPAAYSVRVGSLVKAEFPMSDAFSPQSIIAATDNIDGIFNRQLSVKNDVVELTLAFRDRQAHDVELEVRQALSSIIDDDETFSLSSENIEKLMGGNALAAVTGGRIRIGIENLTDAEIESRIVAALSAQGIQVKQVNVNTDRSVEGQVKVEVRVEAEADEGKLPDIPIDVLYPMEIPDGEHEKIIIRCEKRE